MFQEYKKWTLPKKFEVPRIEKRNLPKEIKVPRIEKTKSTKEIQKQNNK